MDISTIFSSVLAMTAAVIALSEFVDRFWKLIDVAAQVRSLAIGIILGAAGAGLQLGMFSDPTVIGPNAWYVAGPLIGLLCGLIGNWSFATPFIKWLLEFLKIAPPGATVKPTVQSSPK
jgi:hypothetical protein